MAPGVAIAVIAEVCGSCEATGKVGSCGVVVVAGVVVVVVVVNSSPFS